MTEYDMGLCDSATGQSLDAIKVVDVTDLQGTYPHVALAYASARRGRIVQINWSHTEGDPGARIHYFFDEPAGINMIVEDEHRFGFKPPTLLEVIRLHAPD